MRGHLGIQMTGEIEIENCAGVDAAAGWLEFIDDFNGAYLGAQGVGGSDWGTGRAIGWFGGWGGWRQTPR